MFALALRSALPLALGTLAWAQTNAPAPTFAPPVRLMAGEEFLGTARLYPSPVFHDVKGDGLLDVVVGDLPGRLTVALQKKSGSARTFAAETAMNGADGKRIDFHNW